MKCLRLRLSLRPAQVKVLSVSKYRMVYGMRDSLLINDCKNMAEFRAHGNVFAEKWSIQ